MDVKIAKIGILKASDEAIDRMLLKINEGFTGGRVTKVDLTSWIIHYFEIHELKSSIEKIRKDHFNQVTYLETVIRELKLARKSGKSTPDLSSLLALLSPSAKASYKKKSLPKTLES